MKISIIHPSRSRPEKSFKTIIKWFQSRSRDVDIEWVVSLDENDPTLPEYIKIYNHSHANTLVSKNKSAVDAINNGARRCMYDIMVVVSDDTDCFPGWDAALLKELEGKSDYLLKTDDSIQNYIVTMTVMDRKYYERDGFIYHPDFRHQFADTYLTCLADIRGRLLHSNLKFPHLHYSHSGGRETADALHHRNDLTWKEGQDTFIKLMKQFTPEEISRIKDKSMQNFLRQNGVR